MSETTKHTPAPWSINDWPQDCTDIRIGATRTPRIASVHLHDASINEQRANARLIAAAPDLLAALHEITAKFPTEWPAHETKAHAIANQPLRDIVDRARAAISKAVQS